MALRNPQDVNPRKLEKKLYRLAKRNQLSDRLISTDEAHERTALRNAVYRATKKEMGFWGLKEPNRKVWSSLSQEGVVAAVVDKAIRYVKRDKIGKADRTLTFYGTVNGLYVAKHYISMDSGQHPDLRERFAAAVIDRVKRDLKKGHTIKALQTYQTLSYTLSPQDIGRAILEVRETFANMQVFDTLKIAAQFGVPEEVMRDIAQDRHRVLRARNQKISAAVALLRTNASDADKQAAGLDAVAVAIKEEQWGQVEELMRQFKLEDPRLRAAINGLREHYTELEQVTQSLRRDIDGQAGIYRDTN